MAVSCRLLTVAHLNHAYRRRSDIVDIDIVDIGIADIDIVDIVIAKFLPYDYSYGILLNFVCE